MSLLVPQSAQIPSHFFHLGSRCHTHKNPSFVSCIEIHVDFCAVGTAATAASKRASSLVLLGRFVLFNWCCSQGCSGKTERWRRRPKPLFKYDQEDRGKPCKGASLVYGEKGERIIHYIYLRISSSYCRYIMFFIDCLVSIIRSITLSAWGRGNKNPILHSAFINRVVKLSV